jgi:hypothetical protein
MKRVRRNTTTGGRSRRAVTHVGAIVVAPLLGLSAVLGALPGSPAGAAPKFTGRPIAIGTTASIDTAGGNYPGVQDVAVASVDQVNASGGVKTADGKTHELKLVFCNNQNTANGSVTCAQTLIGDHVVAVIGTEDENSSDSDPLYTKAGIANLAPSLLSEWDYAGSDSYPVEGSASFEYSGLALEMGKAGIKSARPASLSETEADTAPLVAAFKAAFTSVGGTTLSPTFFPETTTDYSPVAAQADAGHPGAIVIMTGTQFVTPLAQAVVQLGGKPPNFADIAGTFTPAAFKATPIFSGAISIATFSSTASSGWSAYRSALKKYEPNANPLDVYGYEATAQNVWVGMLAFKTVVSKLSGSITPAAVKAQLNKTTDLSLGGLTPTINFTKPFPCGPFARSFNPDFYGPLVVKGDQFVAKSGAKLHSAASAVITGFGTECQATASQLGVS